jgi:Trk K+ transport system NAD-binding subunit
LVDTLIKAGVPAARCLVAATGDDAANLAISLSAKELNHDLRTIVRLFDAGFAQKVRGSLRMDAVMSASLIAAPSFVGAALHEGALQAFELGGSCLVVLARQRVDSRLAGQRPSEARVAGQSVLMRRGQDGDWRAVVSADEPLIEGEELIGMVSHPLTA